MLTIQLRAPQDTAVPLARSRDFILRVVGKALVVCGGLADGTAGWLAVSQGNGWSVLIHIPAILAWGIGLCVLQRVSIPHDRAPAYTASSAPIEGRIAPMVSRWTIVFVLLGLVVFPGLVPLAWCVAYGFTRICPIGSRSSHDTLFEGLIPREELVEQWASSIAARAVEQTPHMDIEPLVDVIHDPDSELRRGAIAALGKRGDRTAWHLIRSMLKDPDPDVRSDASVLLARLETAMSQAISDAKMQASLDLSAAKHYADLCYQYAISDFLDETSGRFYLLKAKTALREHLACQSGTVDTWVLMARIHVSMGETAEAMRAVQHALALDGEAPEAELFLLGTEIAFRQRDWATLRALAIQASAALQGQDDWYETMRWWAEIPSEPRLDDLLAVPGFRTSARLGEAGKAKQFASSKDAV